VAIVENTFAEAFRSYFSRVLVTADTEELALAAALSSTGFATSALGCGLEAGVDASVGPDSTPDGRPGIMVQFHIWKKSRKRMYEALLGRIGHCILTAPTAAAFDATPKPFDRIDVGLKLRFFGDGFEEEGTVGDREVVVIPIMGGEFIAEKMIGMSKGISGGNIWIMGESRSAAAKGAKAAVGGISRIPGSITPFPGGICASGSKVGSKRYRFMVNSTNDAYCPTLRDRVDSLVPEGVESIMEIVINGISLKAVRAAMKAAVQEAQGVPGVVRISAGNFGGKLGKFKIHLEEL